MVRRVTKEGDEVILEISEYDANLIRNVVGSMGKFEYDRLRDHAPYPHRWPEWSDEVGDSAGDIYSALGRMLRG
jgi:hypothetical protein